MPALTLSAVSLQAVRKLDMPEGALEFEARIRALAGQLPGLVVYCRILATSFASGGPDHQAAALCGEARSLPAQRRRPGLAQPHRFIAPDETANEDDTVT